MLREDPCLHRDSEADALSLSKAVLLAEVAVSFHTKRSTILVPEPARNRGDVHAALDADGGEKVSQIVVGDPLHTDLFRRVSHAVLTLENAHYGRVGRFICTVRTQVGEHSLQFGDHRNLARFTIFRGRILVASHVEFMPVKVHVCPCYVFGFSNSDSTVGEESDQICTVFRLASAGSTNGLDESEKFFA